MKIAMIGQKGVYMTERGGGVEKHVKEIAERLALKEHEVIVYARRRYTPKNAQQVAGVKLVYLPTLYTKNLEAIIHSFFSTLHALFQKYDIIHYHGVGPATLAWLPRLFCPRAKIIVTFHSQDRYHQKWSWFARQYLRFGEWAAIYFSHVCIVVSHVLQVYIRDHMHRQAVYIPNGADIQQVSSSRELARFGLTKGEYILNVGRIVPQKGLQYLIQAYKSVRTNKKLVMVGAPSFSERYFAELKRQVAGNSGIAFLGHHEGEALRQLYAHCWLYVQPSESEGLALTVLEAMSFGKAVLVSDIPENMEAMHGCGFTFANRDSDDLATQITKLLNHPELVADVGKRAQAVIAKEFSWDVVAKHIEEVYVSSRH
ncbi:MAG: glycosyltransferase family 4 protein [Patescibacteria group bacterium]